MPWTISLENEKKEILDSFHDFSIPKTFDENKKNSFTLLKYLDPYGDTTFNHIQMSDLANDLERLRGEISDDVLIDQMISLVNRCKKDVHTHLTFYGD